MGKVRKIRVAIVAPPFGETGGPEVVAKNLAEALSDNDCIDVTLFCPKDWHLTANIKRVDTLNESLWNMSDFKNQTEKVRRNLRISSQIKVLLQQDYFDLIHLHSQDYAYCVGKNSSKPCVLSWHNRITKQEFEQTKEAGIYSVSLSKFQKKFFRTSKTIWNGVSLKETVFSQNTKDYLIAVGRLTEQKGIDIAIQVARKAKRKLLIFGRIGNSEERQTYFKEKIKPFLNKDVIYKGEVSHKELLAYLRNSEALLFTIRRPEVCPMVVLEALASGTPIIGTKVGPLPELLKNKKIAFLSDKEDELVKVAKNTSCFDRLECRKYAEANFSSFRMANEYLKLYKKIINAEKRRIDHKC